MLALTREFSTFPSLRIPSRSGGLPVEVTLLAQLLPGQGDAMVAGIDRRQRGHADFVDALDEPSVRIGAMDLAQGDASSLYTFVVGDQGHPFHRHAGHRAFTAIAGSSGAQLRFSTASQAQVDADPDAFVQALHLVDIPPDCLFTVRFGGGTWHQFVPLRAGRGHPALFAVSSHPDELGGGLDDATRARVLANEADIPSLTETLPAAVEARLQAALRAPASIARTALSLHAPPTSPAARACAWLRDHAGRAWARFARRAAGGFLADNGGGRTVHDRGAPASGSLLRETFADRFDSEDLFEVVLDPREDGALPAPALLSAVLQGFLDNRPLGVSRLMALRNGLVKPLGLRTSPLGCPVSSLLAADPALRFDARFPVLDQRIAADGSAAEVLLGADDRHLAFRSVVAVRRHADGRVACALGTRVRTRNPFGRAYMALIRRVHHHYIAPTMLRLAVDHAVRAQLPRAALAPVAHVPGGLALHPGQA